MISHYAGTDTQTITNEDQVPLESCFSSQFLSLIEEGYIPGMQWSTCQGGFWRGGGTDPAHALQIDSQVAIHAMQGASIMPAVPPVPLLLLHSLLFSFMKVHMSLSSGLWAKEQFPTYWHFLPFWAWMHSCEETESTSQTYPPPRTLVRNGGAGEKKAAKKRPDQTN